MALPNNPFNTTGTGKTTGGTNDLGNLVGSLGLSGSALKAFNAKLAAATSGGTSTGAGTKTTITQYNPADLVPIITPIWRATTGKDASNQEINAITQAVNAAMKENPKMISSTGGPNASKTSIPALKPAEVIQQQALQNPQTAGFQAATTYYDALLKVINGPMGGGF